MHIERPIEIKRHRFNALLITRATWRHIDGPSEIQRPRLNRDNSQSRISSESLIEELKLDRTVTPNSPYKLRCSLTC